MNTFLKHLLVICLLVVLGGGEALANQSTYPYRTIVTVNPTGAGRAYASYDENAKTATNNTANYDANIDAWSRTSCTATVNLVATAGTGYRFLRWTDSNNSTISAQLHKSVAI